MYMVRWWNLSHKFRVIVGILLLKFSCLHQNNLYASGTDGSLFRFYDFEPRVLQSPFSNITIKQNLSDSNGRVSNSLSSRKRAQTAQRKEDSGSSTAVDREGRGFHFYSSDKDTTVDLEFVVPFIRIPIENGMQLTTSTLRSVLDLKTNSLLWIGALVTVGTLAASIFNTASALTPAVFMKEQSKRKNGKRSDLDGFIGDSQDLRKDGTLENNIDPSACIQKMICLYIQKAATDVRSGKASDAQKIFDGLASVQLLSQFFGGTAVQVAIEGGRNSRCHKWKKRCKLFKGSNVQEDVSSF